MRNQVLLVLFLLFFSTICWAGWYTNCPSCVRHLGGSGVAGPYGSQSECESERRTSSMPWGPCYSSGGDSSSSDTSAQDAANAAAWARYYQAKEEARVEKANELRSKDSGARATALSNSQTLDYLYNQAMSGGLDFDGRNAKSSRVKYNKITGRYDVSDLVAENKIKDSVADLEDDPFTNCMRGLASDATYGVDLAAVKNCGNTPAFSLDRFTKRFDPKTIDLFIEGMKKIPGVDAAFEGAKIWTFAAKLAGLWELAWIAKINDEMMPIGGAPTKKDVKAEFEKNMKEMGADVLTGFITDQAADQAKEFLHPEVLSKNGVFIEPMIKIETAPISDKIKKWVVSENESSFEFPDDPGEGTTDFFKGLPK